MTQANKIEIDEVMATREQVEREQKDLKIRRDMLEAEFSKKKKHQRKVEMFEEKLSYFERGEEEQVRGGRGATYISSCITSETAFGSSRNKG